MPCFVFGFWPMIALIRSFLFSASWGVIPNPTLHPFYSLPFLFFYLCLWFASWDHPSSASVFFHLLSYGHVAMLPMYILPSSVGLVFIGGS